MNLGRAIRVARASAGITQIELARRLEVTANYISLLENNRRDPSWSFVVRLSKALGVPLALLILIADENGSSGSSTRTAISADLLSLVTSANKSSRRRQK